MPVEFTGSTWVKVNGQLYYSDAEPEINPGGFTGESVPADGLPNVGTKRLPVAASGSFTLNHHAGFNLRDFADLRDFTIDYETDTGVLMRCAGCNWEGDPPSLRGGKVECSFVGSPAIQV